MTATPKIEDELDEEFSKLIRKKGFCEKCQRKGMGYEASHVIPRDNHALRWDILNALCLCPECHRWWHNEPIDAIAWFKYYYPERWEYLNFHKYDRLKRSRKELKELLENIKDGKFRDLILDKLE